MKPAPDRSSARPDRPGILQGGPAEERADAGLGKEGKQQVDSGNRATPVVVKTPRFVDSVRDS
jgi:hypothetical protein